MNKLEENLVKALEKAKLRKEKNLNPLICVVYGEIGCGKSEIIRNFLLKNEKSYCELDAYMLEIQSQSILLEDFDNNPPIFNEFEINNLNRSNIVFIDNYDYACLDIRNEILKYVNSQEVVDIREENKNNNYLKKLNKPTMIIVVLHGRSLKFAGFLKQITTKEQEFFKVKNLNNYSPIFQDNVFVIPYQSDKQDCLDYINSKLDEKINQIKEDTQFDEDEKNSAIRNIEKNKYYATKILTDSRFEFTDFNKTKKETIYEKYGQHKATTSRSISHLFLFENIIDKSTLLNKWDHYCDVNMKSAIMVILNDEN